MLLYLWLIEKYQLPTEEKGVTTTNDPYVCDDVFPITFVMPSVIWGEH